MALELYPTPSWPRTKFAIPLSVEHKKFPQDSEMATHPLSGLESGDSENAEIISYWACDCVNLYLAVDVPGSVNTDSEKAWRYGDGLLLTISQLADANPVNCYTSFGFSGTTKKPQIAAVNPGGGKLDCTNIKYKLQQGSGKSRFSLVIPWSVLPPVRPLLYSTVALNLTFIRRLDSGHKTFQLVQDENYDTENTELRRLLPVAVSCSDLSLPLAQSFLTRSCWQGKSPLQINLGIFNPKTCPAKLILTIKDGSNILESHSSSVELASGCHRWTLKWSPQLQLSTGEYTLELSGEGWNKNYKKQHQITIINPDEITSLRNDLQELEEDIKCLYPGAVQTALACLDWLEADIEGCSWTLPDLSCFRLAKAFRDSLRNGKNPLEDKHGLSRRAYRSKTDGSLQPYSLYLPKGFSPDRKWPLLMVLQASPSIGDDIEATPELHRLADKLGIILLYPAARDLRSFCLHGGDEAAMENLAVIKKRLPLDWNKLFLSGLSLGGLFAWHTGMKYSNQFAGMAVISGLTSASIAEGHQDYGFNPAVSADKAKNLALLVMHGAKDSIIPAEQVREIIAGLKEKNVQLTYKEFSSGGHRDYDWSNELASWLKPLLKN